MIIKFLKDILNLKVQKIFNCIYQYFSLFIAMEGIALKENMISPYAGDLFHEVRNYTFVL
jgi:hypothetical protein